MIGIAGVIVGAAGVAIGCTKSYSGGLAVMWVGIYMAWRQWFGVEAAEALTMFETTGYWLVIAAFAGMGLFAERWVWQQWQGKPPKSAPQVKPTTIPSVEERRAERQARPVFKQGGPP